MSQIIFFTGMPASGKTKWGRAVAKHFSLPFIDLDEFIEQQQGKSIHQIFEESGETFFRKIETDFFKKIVAANESLLVLSCGGGTTVDASNLDLMKKNGIVIFLNAQIATLINHLQNDTVKRPLLVNPLEQLESLYLKRKEIYQQADYILAVETLTINQFEPIIKACIKQH